MKHNNNNQLTALAILAVTGIATVAMILMSVTNAIGQDNKPSVWGMGIGATHMSDMIGCNVEINWLNEGSNKGGYLGADIANASGGADDLITVYFGKAYRIGTQASFRIGTTLGATSTGNTVTDLSAYGMGRLVGTDGADGFIGSLDTGFTFPLKKKTKHNYPLNLMMMGGFGTHGPSARLAFLLLI
tara:strand:- start:108 stop:668 length:561 start_codon:yes stop_codon:yes gene_type:complete